MKEPTMIFVEKRDGHPELVVNFGVFSGREATGAEVYRLAQSLLQEVRSVEVVCERRFEFDSQVEATVHQVRIRLPASVDGGESELIPLVYEWANDCIGERRTVVP
jgi:hypothetical protein